MLETGIFGPALWQTEEWNLVCVLISRESSRLPNSRQCEFQDGMFRHVQMKAMCSNLRLDQT
jgi:hypothetical protein